MQPSSNKSDFMGNGGDFLLIIIGSLVLCLIIAMLTSCKHVEYVTVPEVHTEIHHTIDSVRQVDSVIDRHTVVVREVDSATMAQYGIQLEHAQRAWLIQSDRLQREIERLRETKGDTVIIRDSVPVPYPIEVVKKETYVPGLVRFLAWIGGILLLVVIAFVSFKYIIPIIKKLVL